MRASKYLNLLRENYDCRERFIDLILRIGEALEEWDKCLTPEECTNFSEEDRFFAALRYSEFLLDDDEPKNNRYYYAEERRMAILGTIGVTTQEVNDGVEKYFNRK